MNKLVVVWSVCFKCHTTTYLPVITICNSFLLLLQMVNFNMGDSTPNETAAEQASDPVQGSADGEFKELFHEEATQVFVSYSLKTLTLSLYLVRCLKVKIMFPLKKIFQFLQLEVCVNN